MQIPTILLAASIAVICFVGCASNSRHPISQPEVTGFAAIGALPLDTRTASTLDQVNGFPPELPGEGTTEQDTSLLINSDGLDFSFGRYVFGLPLDATLLGLDINVEDVTSEYWIGLSGYGTTGGWEWQGPFVDDKRIDFDSSFANYLSPNDNLYWVVATTQGHSVLLVSSTVDYAPWHIQFRLPPGGQHLAAPSPALSPSMILMPVIDDWSDEGAPVIFYTAIVESNPYVFLAYYNGTMWKQRGLFSGDRSMSQPKAIWTGSGGVIFAYDHSAGASGFGQLVMLTTDDTWAVTSTVEIGDVEGKTLLHLKVDYDPESGDFLVLHAYSVDPVHEVYISQGQTLAWETTQPTLLLGDKIAGADVSFDPGGGEPWAVFSSGTIDQSSTIILDFILNMGRFNGTDWNWSPLDNDEPLTVDLGFQEDNTAQLVMISVHNWSWPFPPITASVLADISVGKDVGLGWNFTTLHTSVLDTDEVLNYKLGLDLGVDCTWATTSSLSFARADGYVDFDISPFRITDGTLMNHINYYVDGGGGYGSSNFFTGDPGIAFSWQLGAPGLMCAYIFADELDITQALGGSVDPSNNLVFWRPGG